MTGNSSLESPPTEIFSALSDPIRWSIIVQAARVEELACITLEDTLPVAKPTISYHIKILQNAGLISTRKAGRNYYYSLRRDIIRDVLDGLWELAPLPRPVVETENGPMPARYRRKRKDAAGLSAIPRASASRTPARDDEIEEAVVLTW
jgi:DNA-binding transcriptional ArsR family regulator